MSKGSPAYLTHQGHRPMTRHRRLKLRIRNSPVRQAHQMSKMTTSQIQGRVAFSDGATDHPRKRTWVQYVLSPEMQRKLFRKDPARKDKTHKHRSGRYHKV